MRDFIQMWKDDLWEVKGIFHLRSAVTSRFAICRVFKRICLKVIVFVYFFSRCFVFCVDVLWFLWSLGLEMISLKLIGEK